MPKIQGSIDIQIMNKMEGGCLGLVGLVGLVDTTTRSSLQFFSSLGLPARRYSLIWPRAMKAKNVTIPMKMQATMMRSVLRDISSSRIAWTSVRSFAATIRVMTCSANVGGITTQREVTASSRSSNLGSSQRARRRGSCGCR